MVSVEQITVGGFDFNFSYLLCDEMTGDAAIVDPCGDVDMIRKALSETSIINPKYILITHGHNDHISGIGEVRTFFDAPVVGHRDSPCKIDIKLDDMERIVFGETELECLYTPGHTNDSVVYHLCDDSAIFTGDTLFIDCCGYCDAKTMFATMRNKLFPLADSNEVYSGHNYGRVPHGPLGVEKIRNPYLANSDFKKFQAALGNL